MSPLLRVPCMNHGDADSGFYRVLAVRCVLLCLATHRWWMPAAVGSNTMLETLRSGRTRPHWLGTFQQASPPNPAPSSRVLRRRFKFGQTHETTTHGTKSR